MDQSNREQDAPATLVPRLRFPEFRDAEAWRLETGSSLFNQINDRNPQPGLPVLAITQEYGAIPRHMIDYHVSVSEKSIESYKVVREGDFIISLRSFQGGIEYSKYHGICSPAYVILRRHGMGCAEYFIHYLKTERFIRILTKNLEGLRDGKMISYTQFSALQIPIPTLAEQQRIADCLSSLDALIAAQARKVDALKSHKKGLMQQLFPRDGETQPRLRFPEFQDAGEWESGYLDNVLIAVSNGLSLPQSADNTGYKVTRIETISAGNIDLEKVGYVTTIQDISSYRLNIGDILFSNINSVAHIGKSVYVDKHYGLYHGMNLLRFVVNTHKCDPKFLFYLINTSGIREYFRARANKAVNQASINQTELGKTFITAPTLPEQQRIADCLSSLDAVISAATQRIAALKTHKQGLMQQLFPAIEEQNTL